MYLLLQRIDGYIILFCTMYILDKCLKSRQCFVDILASLCLICLRGLSKLFAPYDLSYVENRCRRWLDSITIRRHLLIGCSCGEHGFENFGERGRKRNKNLRKGSRYIYSISFQTCLNLCLPL